MAKLYDIWKKNWEAGTLPPEWENAGDFLGFATANGYKPEFGYDGEFNPENLLAAIKKAKKTGEEDKSPAAETPRPETATQQSEPAVAAPTPAAVPTPVAAPIDGKPKNEAGAAKAGSKAAAKPPARQRTKGTRAADKSAKTEG